MSYSARIDELEKKFSENARRYFAPLANEYRKAGDLDRAIEICRAHLPQQPGHMSGHVVYGQALYEARQLEEAKTVFEAALALDPENLIALRHLGDIARDGGDPIAARTWYLRVLDADPRNDEVAGMLAELEAAAQTAPAASSESPAQQEEGGWGDINPERGSDSGQATQSRPETPPSSSAADERLETAESAREVAGGEADDADASTDAIDVAELGLEPMPSDSAAAESLPESSGREDRADGPHDDEARTPRPASLSLDRMLNEAFAPDDEGTGQEQGGDPLAAAAFGRPRAAEGEIAPAGPDAPTDAASPPHAAPPALDDGAFAEVDALFDEISPPGERSARSTGSSAAIPEAKSATVQGEASVSRHEERAASPEGRLTGDAMFGDADLGGEADSAPAGKSLPGLETSEFVPPQRTAAPSSGTTRNTGSMAVSGLTTFEQPSEEDSSTRAAFVTETMAELYLQQGFTEEALDIYRQLLEQNPEDANLRERIEHLERGGKTSLSVAAVSSEVIEAAQQRHAARRVRTVRSFFGQIAGHQVQPREAEGAENFVVDDDPRHGDRDAADASGEAPPSVAGGSRDERSGGPVISVISDLFGEASVNEADEAAASMLASAFSTSFPGGDDSSSQAPRAGDERGGHAPPSGSGKAAHTAGRELSLDQVFRDSGTRTQRKSGGYSFDEFFSDGSPGAGRQTPAEGTDAGVAEDDAEGDLEQFTAWLEGLKRK